jgi:dipeptidase D
VIDYFLQITQIPRPSGHEEQIRQRLIDRAKQRNFDTQVDQAGNLVVSVPATDNLQDRPTIILQSHMDMVTVA